MAVKAHELYQGDDWLTYRPTVAQAFDTLDRLRDLCENGAVEVSALPPDAAWQPVDVIGQQSGAMLMTVLSGLCDDLDGELEAVLAELSPLLRHDAAHRWMGFEMQLHLKSIRTLAQSESVQAESIPALMEQVYDAVELIVAALKQIDQ